MQHPASPCTTVHPTHRRRPGIIDHFHLADPIPAADWASRYSEGQKLKVGYTYY
jgi:hypothetical protein